MRLDELTDVRYAVQEQCAIVTMDRPDRMNAFRGRTVDELISAFKHAWADPPATPRPTAAAGGSAQPPPPPPAPEPARPAAPPAAACHQHPRASDPCSGAVDM